MTQRASDGRRQSHRHDEDDALTGSAFDTGRAECRWVGLNDFKPFR